MRRTWRKAARLTCLGSCVLFTFCTGGGTVGAADAKDVLQLTALTGPKGGDVTITVPATEGGAGVESFEHVHIRLLARSGSDEKPNRIINPKDVAAPEGVGNVELGPLERGTVVEVQVHVRERKPPRTSILRGDGIARLRPDLVVAAVHAPEQTLSTRAIDVVADIDELNAETGTKTTLTLMLGPTPLAEPQTMTVAAGGATQVTFEGVLVRIFYNDNWEERLPTAPQNLASFIRTVELAHDSGATINITYQTASVARLNPVPSMTRFAAVLEDLVVARGFTNVRWVTVQNEPNTPGAAITLDQYNALYRALHTQLVARGLRDHLRLMGGDLIESSGARHQEIWFEYIEQNMNDILDAYSVHIYWQYFDMPRMEFRLKDVRRIVTEEIAPEARKPTYIMEFGVRGLNTAPGKPPLSFAYWEDGTEMRKTNVAAFQQLWFNIASAQLGYTGASKWDAFWGLYDNSSTGNQSYWMFGPASEGWPVFPTYYALKLLLTSTQRGWEVVQVAPWEDDDWQVGSADEAEKEIAAYASTDGKLTLMGLDTHGRNLNTASDERPQYSIGGLPANTQFSLALWNATGNGENSLAGAVTTNAVGVARFEVPLHAAFSPTTLPVS